MLIGLRRVRGASMLPTYSSGALLLVSSLIKPRVNSVVVALLAGEEVVKRVRSITIDGRYYLEGDNHQESVDSREYGPVPASGVFGTVVWPRRK